jgi:hypothetical protein
MTPLLLGLGMAPSTQLFIILESEPNNRFGIALTDGNQDTERTFHPAIDVDISIHGDPIIILTPNLSDTTAIQLSNELTQSFVMDEISLPSNKIGEVDIKVQAVDPSGNFKIEPLTVKATLGCSDAQSQSLMECLVNCGSWVVSW